MLFIIEIFAEFSLEMKPYLHLAACQLILLSDCECVDKEDGEAKRKINPAMARCLSQEGRFLFSRVTKA